MREKFTHEMQEMAEAMVEMEKVGLTMKRGRRRGLARGALAGLRALRRCAMRFTAGERSSNAAAYAGEGDASSAAADRSTRDAGVLLERVSLCPEYCRSNRGLRS